MIGGKSHVAPPAKTSAVLALLNAETSIMKMATATMMTVALVHSCWTKFRIRVGTRSKSMTSHAMIAREIDVILVPVGMKTFGSFDITDCRCYIYDISKREEQKRSRILVSFPPGFF